MTQQSCTRRKKPADPRERRETVNWKRLEDRDHTRIADESGAIGKTLEWFWRSHWERSATSGTRNPPLSSML
jgi:hypothetical protein